MRGTIVTMAVGFLLAVGAIALTLKWLGPEASRARTVMVKGQARVAGEPDTALVQFGVASTGKTVAEGQQRMSKTISKVIAAVQAAGVKKEDVTTSNLSISQSWDYRKKRPSGFDVAGTLTITVRNVLHVGRVVDAAVASGLNRLQGVSYDVRNQVWRRKAMAEALQQAREKAEAIAARTGRPLGRAISVQETAEWQTSPQEDYSSAGEYERGALYYDAKTRVTMPTTRALPGQRALTSQVVVTYEL